MNTDALNNTLPVTQVSNVTAAVQRADKNDPQFQAMLQKAGDNIRTLTSKLIASTFLQPILAQMRDDPFKSEMFHGGFGEDVFMQQLDTHLADGIAARTDLPISQKLYDNVMNQIKHDYRQVKQAANMRVDLVG